MDRPAGRSAPAHRPRPHQPPDGQDLGVSFAGAKWHVSEVLSKLGVLSREDAAAYWRWHTSRRVRAKQWMRAAVALGMGKAAAAGLLVAGLATAVIGVTVIIAGNELTGSAPVPPTGKLLLGPTVPGITPSAGPVSLPTAVPTVLPDGVLALDQVGDVTVLLTAFDANQFTSRFTLVFLAPGDSRIDLDELADQFALYVLGRQTAYLRRTTLPALDTAEHVLAVGPGSGEPQSLKIDYVGPALTPSPAWVEMINQPGQRLALTTDGYFELRFQWDGELTSNAVDQSIEWSRGNRSVQARRCSPASLKSTA